MSVGVLTACGSKNEPDENTQTESNKEQETTENNNSSDKSQKGMVRSPLTNEWIDESLENQRPIAVMTPNDSSALPQYSVSKADIIYEIMVEGNLTRLMQVILDWKDLERIGNVRSARHYFALVAYEWDPILCHYGNPFWADPVLERAETHNINGLVAPSGVFYRTNDRKAPQNAYLNAEGIIKGAEANDYPLEYTNRHEGNHYQFADENNTNDLSKAPGVMNASKIDLSKAYPVNKPTFEYNAEDGLYYRYQYGEPHIDGENDEQLAFKNVLVQNTYWETLDDKGYLTFQMHDDTRDGYFFTEGKAIHVTWKKTSDFGATRYYDDNGTEITLNTGKTMVCIVQEGREVTFE